MTLEVYEDMYAAEGEARYGFNLPEGPDWRCCQEQVIAMLYGYA